jgi:hypothetical protein
MARVGTLESMASQEKQSSQQWWTGKACIGTALFPSHLYRVHVAWRFPAPRVIYKGYTGIERNKLISFFTDGSSLSAQSLFKPTIKHCLFVTLSSHESLNSATITQSLGIEQRPIDIMSQLGR